MWAKIRQKLAQHPSVGKGLVLGMLICGADAVSQICVEKAKFDWQRNMEFMVLGLAWLAPCIQIWYSHLLPAITQKYLAHMPKARRIIFRLAIDTLVFAPVSYTGFYLIKDVAMRPGREFTEIKNDMIDKFVSTLLADWAIWTPANFVNFWWVPVQWQGLYVGFFSFFFNVVLSYIANQEGIEKQNDLKEREENGVETGEERMENLKNKIKDKVQSGKIEIIL